MTKPIQLLFILLVLIFAGCGGKTEKDDPAPSDEGKVAANVDGQKWNSISATASLVHTGTYQISIMGKSSDGTSIIITRKHPTSVIGQLLFNPGASSTTESTLSYSEDSSSPATLYTSACDNGSGHVTISTHNSKGKTLSGVFAGTVCTSAGKKKNIYGSFTDVKYQ